MPRHPNPAPGRTALAFAFTLALTAVAGFATEASAQEAAHAPKAAAHDVSDVAKHDMTEATGGHPKASGDPNIFEPQPALMLYTVVVFLGVLAILGRFAWKPLIAALHQREEHLEHVLLETERARNESEQLLAEHRRRLAATEDQVRAMIDEATRKNQEIASEMIRKAESESETLRERATREISSAKDQALAEVWTKTADLAVSVASKVLGKSIGGDDHRRLIDAAIGELPAAPNGQTAGGARRMSDLKTADAAPKTVFDESSFELTRSYSDALLNAAEKGDEVGAVLDDLDAIQKDVIEAYPMFAAMMASPTRGVAEKDRTIVTLFEGKALPTVVRFLRVLNRHGRLGLLGPIAQAARASWDRRQGRKPVTVRSAAPLDESQLAALRDKLAAGFGGSPVLTTVIDPTLIGGLVIQIGDDVYDASVRNSLQRLRQRLIQGTTHEVQSRRNHFSDTE